MRGPFPRFAGYTRRRFTRTWRSSAFSSTATSTGAPTSATTVSGGYGRFARIPAATSSFSRVAAVASVGLTPARHPEPAR
ncbi:hypothetical protein [Cryptosporangium japonicum]|uniref:hypothetical protein n=1 Tax=Cryptosporangium japonicum TaxID=80872 RepID=UPI0031DD82CD